VNPLIVLPLTAALVIFGLGVSVLMRRTPRSLNQLYFLFCAALTLWTLGGFILSHQITADRAMFWAELLQYGVIFAPVLFLHLVVELFGLGRRYLLVPVYLACACLAAANGMGLVVESVQRVSVSSSVEQWYAVGGSWRPLLIIYALVLTSTLMTVLFTVARHSSGRRRTQARYLLMAVGLGFAGALHDSFGLAGVETYPSTSVPIYPIGSLAMVVWASIPAYTLHRSRLIDIDVAVARTFSSLFVLVLLMMTCFGGLLAAENAYFGGIDAEFSFVALVVILTAAFVFPRVRVVAQETIENVLFGSEKDYQSALYELSQQSSTMVELDDLLCKVCEVLTSTHGVVSAVVYVDDGHGRFRAGAWRGRSEPPAETLESDDAAIVGLQERRGPTVREELALGREKSLRTAARMSDLVVEIGLPLMTSERFVGAVFLGPKENGSVFSSDDIKRMTILGNQLAVAVLNARLYSDLSRSQEIIQQSDRLSAIGTMAAVLAHEIRNPLVSIRTFTQLLPERYNDPEFRSSFLDLTLSEVDRISSLINEVLAFARPAPAELCELDVKDCITTISRLLETQAKNKGVTLNLDLCGELPRVTADEDQIKQVVINIVMNAIEACSAGGEVEVSNRERFTDGTAYVCVEVRDSGRGIDEKDREQIFEPFFTTRKEGTGLGLAIARQIITKHGGFIEVESTIGVGTTFRLHLPVHPMPMTERMTRLEMPEPGVHG